MQSREEIQELNDHLQAFPKSGRYFCKRATVAQKSFFALMSIDLAEINPDWAGQKVSYGCAPLSLTRVI